MATVRNKAHPFDGVDTHLHSPAQSVTPSIHQETVTPSDTLNFSRPSRELFIGTGGTVRCVRPNGETQDFVVPDGGRIPGVFIRVNSTGTVTADNIVSMS